MDDVRSADEVDVAEGGRRVRAPLWYYLILGDLAGSAVVVILLAPGLPAAIAVLALVLANALLTALRRRVAGEPPSAWSPRALPYTASGIVVVLGALALGWFLVFSQGIDWAAWFVGAVVFAAIGIFGWLGDREV